MQKRVHRHAVCPSPYGLPDPQALRHLTDHQPSPPHTNRHQPTHRVPVSSWMFYHCKPDCVDLCSVDPESSLFSLLVIRRFLYLNLVEGTQISSPTMLRRCFYIASTLLTQMHRLRGSLLAPSPAQPSPAQPENTPLAYCAPHSCCGHVYSEADGKIGANKTASCHSVSPRCTALLPMNPVYCCKNAKTLD